MRILGLDTATEACSAALSIDGRVLEREVEIPRGHAELILGMIDELLAEAAIGLRGLDAIAFGRGPGSFTGVRLAASVTQGLAFGAGLPAIPVSDLRAVAQRSVTRSTQPRQAGYRMLVCNDARMHEVYWGCFELGADGLMRPVGVEHVSKPDGVQIPESWAGSAFHAAGRGFAAYPELCVGLTQGVASIEDQILPGAREIALLGESEMRLGRSVRPEEALPVYLRDDVARPKAHSGHPPPEVIKES